MTDDQTNVDVLSLADFHATLAVRLQDVDAILTKFETQLRGNPPRLGTFPDAGAKSDTYTALFDQRVERVNRLRAAIVAAQDATAAIISNYRTTEALNAAGAKDIADRLGGVADAFYGEQ